MQNMNEKNESKENFSDFIQKHRRAFLVLTIIIVVLAVASIAFFSVMDVFREKAITKVEALGSRYEELRSALNDEESLESVLQFIQEIEDFANSNSGYAGGRAWFIAGNMHSERKDWPRAEEAWVNAAKKIPKAYMAPIAWFNAGAAAEEQGRAEEAIDYYRNCISAPSGFSSAPRAQFSIGRIYESLDNAEAAIEAYRVVISDWPQDQTWNNMAQSRIITIEAMGIPESNRTEH